MMDSKKREFQDEIMETSEVVIAEAKTPLLSSP